MKRKYILDCIITLLAIVCVVAIVGSVRATSDIKTNIDVQDKYTDETTTNKTKKDTNNKNIITTSGIKGDVNGDGKVELSDATNVLAYVANQELYFKKATVDELKVADIDGDGIITYEDAVYILQYYSMNAAMMNPTWEDAMQEAKKEAISSVED